MLSLTVIGRGLAGAVLYEVLRERGVEVRVIDAPRNGRASFVASGIVNPIVLRRLVPSWRAAELLRIAERFYRSLEKRYNIRIWQPLPLVRLFGSTREREEWAMKGKDPVLAPFLSLGSGEEIPPSSFIAPYGHGVVGQCAWLDVPALLDAQRAQLLREGLLSEEVQPEHAHRVTGQGRVIHCTGPFSDVPGMVPVKGEVLTVRIPGLGTDAIVHGGVFLLPIGNDVFRLGSTFAWDDLWSGPSDQARRELLRRLRSMTEAEVEVIDHQAGVRPTARDRRPILGGVHGRAGTFVFNGLGSRGVLLAPWCATHLADHLLMGTPLDAEVDAARFRD